MAQDHVALLHTSGPEPRRRSSPELRLGQRRQAARHGEPETHVVVATQNLPRMSASIAALVKAGFMVTAYASPVRLLPRLHRMSANPVGLLVIDGGLAPAFARAAAIAARAAYAALPIVLLVPADATLRPDFMPEGVLVMPLPLADAHLVQSAVSLTRFGLARAAASHGAGEPPDAA